MLLLILKFLIHFQRKKRFVDIYRTLQRFDELSWTDILEYGDDRSKFRVPESVIDEMEKNFIDGSQEVLIAEAEKFSPFLERLVEDTLILILL